MDVGVDTADDADESVEDTGGDTSADAEDVEEDTPRVPAALRVEPSQLFFESVEIGQSATASITLANVGGSPLYITDAAITERDPENAAELVPGENWIDGEHLEIEPGTHTTIDVVYAPDDHATDSGFVTIHSTDPENTQVVVPIETVNSYPDVDVPRTIRFGTVPVGESATEEVAIHNRGTSPLTVDEILMSGDSSFSVALQSPYETPTVIEKDDYIIFELTYAPSDEETDTATIFVESNDPDQESFEIGVIGNEPTPCIRVSKNSLDFGEVGVGERSTQSLTVLNCSQTRQLRVSQITLSTDGGGAFSVAQAPQTPAVIEPTMTEQVEIAVEADAARDAAGVLVIESNDPQQSGVVVDLRASFVE